MAYDEALTADPTLVDAYLGRGRVLSQQKRFNQAVQDFSEAIRLAAKDPSPYLERGKAYYESKQVDDAIKDYRAYLNLFPDNPDAYFELATALRDRDPPGALDSYSKALASSCRRIECMRSADRG